MKVIDVRSDTVTQPTAEMRKAMAEAAVGDDVFEEDPTVNQLQELAADQMGMEAGLFTTSGTMGNLLAIMTHCERRQAAIMGQFAHTALYEAGGSASVAGVFTHTVRNLADGSIDLDEAQTIVDDQENVHHPDCGLVIIENTQNYTGGLVVPVVRMRETASFAANNKMKSHVDGARIFNASVSLGVSPEEIVKGFDSVSFCLSKALAAPVGSVLCGKKSFIRRARKNRKMIGGGMRQAGILAAAGIVALKTMPQRLSKDHAAAKRLAAAFAEMKNMTVENAFPPSNMVFLNFPSALVADSFCVFLRNDGILVNRSASKRVRLVTHYEIDDDAIERIISSANQWTTEANV